MSNFNLLPSHEVAILGVVDPDANVAAAYTSAWCSMVDFERMMAIIQVGTMATNSTVDAILQQASDSSGTGVKAITGKAITQLTEAGTDSDMQAIINVRGDELDVNNSFTHVRILRTVATAASDSSAIMLGFSPHQGPANDNDVSTVDEIVA